MDPITVEELLALPQTRERWVIAVRALRIWIEPEGEQPTRPYLTIVANTTPPGLIRGMDLGEQPDPQQAEQSLLAFMARPQEEMGFEPQKPARVFFEDRELLEAIAPTLKAIGVDAKYRGRSELVDELVAELEEQLREGAPENPGLLSQRKVSPKILGEFFAAAADFYRAEPWVQLGNYDLLAVRVGDQKEPYFVTVMGQAGMEYGLALYLDWEQLLRMYQAQGRAFEMQSGEEIHTLLFEPITTLPFDDLEAVERYGWEIAGPQAYPVPMIFVPPDEIARPDGDLLVWYTAALRAIPIFVEGHLERDEHGDIQPAQARLSVAGPTGKLRVEVTYPAGELPERLPGAQPSDLEMEALEDEFDLPFDRRAMEASMAAALGNISESALPSDVQEAQQVMYRAWEETNPARRIALARKALKISADCADAYVLLAEEEADTLERGLEYYREGVEAGRRALGKAYFQENEGHFWGLLETRPFMRAMQGMASSLWETGRKEESLRTYLEMLNLNPGDNQGIRYVLVDLLQAANRYEALADLLKIYEDDWTAVWRYTTALLKFRQEGASEQANRDLRHAFKQNPHVPPYLTGEKRVPHQRPETIGLGDENEAVSYASDHLNYWRRVPGAVAWLKEQWAIFKAWKQALIEASGFDIGDSAQVKAGVLDPDLGTDISGWQGRIVDIDEDEDTGKPMLMIHLDSQTLEAMPEDYIARCEEMGLVWPVIHLPAEDALPAEERDDPEDRREVILKIFQRLESSAVSEQDNRIRAVLERAPSDDLPEQFEAWGSYLQAQLTFPFEAEVVEAQDSGDLEVDDRVKVTSIKGVDEFAGVMVRVSKKGYRGVVPLAELDVLDEELPQYQPVDDYLAWFWDW